MAETTHEPLGKVEQMLVDMIDGEPIVETPDNKIQGLLMELADVIAEGGGGVTGVKGSAESTYRKGNVSISKDDIGLENVDNTSDLNKPVSTAQQTALDGKVGYDFNAKTGVHQLIPYPYVGDAGASGLTFTENANRSITVSAGTATGIFRFKLFIHLILINYEEIIDFMFVPQRTFHGNLL